MKKKFRSLVEQSLVGVYIMQDEKFVYVNPGFEKIMGYSIDELKETSFNQWIYEEDLEKIKENYLSRVSGEKPTDQYTFRAVRRDGALLYIEAIVSKIIYGNRPPLLELSLILLIMWKRKNVSVKRLTTPRKKNECRSVWNFMIMSNRSWRPL